MIGKLLSAASVGSTLANIGLLHRFLSSLVGIIMLSVISAFMLCVLLAGGFAMTGFFLIHFGLDPYVAVISLAVFACVVAALLVAATMARIRQLRDLSVHSLPGHGSGALDPTYVINAFLDGFLNPRE